MTKEKEMLELAQQLLDGAHYSTELSRLESHCREIAGKLEALAEDGEPQSPTLWGQIADIYGELDAEDCAWIDREWAKMRGYILPTDGTSTLTRPDRKCKL